MNRTSPDELIDRIQSRVMALDMELRQMGREELISSSQYHKRTLVLKKLQIQLSQLKYHRRLNEMPVKDSSQWFEIPPARHRSPEETVVCLDYLRESANLLRYLIKESELTGRLVRQSVKGRWFDFLSRFDLAKVRRQLQRLAQKLKSLDVKKKQWDQYILKVRHHLKMPLRASGQGGGTRSFKSKYFETERLNRELLQTKHRCEKMADELDLMENWLSFQEWRLIRNWTPGDRKMMAERPGSVQQSVGGYPWESGSGTGKQKL